MSEFSIQRTDEFLKDRQTVSEFRHKMRNKPALEANSSQESFGQVLQKSINDVNKLQLKADKEIEKLSVGETNNIPEVMMAVEKADIAFKLMVQIRNKVIDAYQEIMKMQV